MKLKYEIVLLIDRFINKFPDSHEEKYDSVGTKKGCSPTNIEINMIQS